MPVKQACHSKKLGSGSPANMPKSVRLRKEAEVEATEARLWHEAISDDIAAGFVRDLQQALVAIATRPEAYPRYEGEQRL
jgi:hypothetical protein